MGLLYKRIRTDSGIYKVRVPQGRIGAIHFAILTKSAPVSAFNQQDDLEDEVTIDQEPVVNESPKRKTKVDISPGDIERMGDIFVEWTQKVLPHIYVEGPYPLAEMPGGDQYGIYCAMTEVTLGKSEGELFQILDDGPEDSSGSVGK